MDRKSSSAVALLLAASAFYTGEKSAGGAAGTTPPPTGTPAAKSPFTSESGEGPWTPICEHFRQQRPDPDKSIDVNITIKGTASGSNLKTDILGKASSKKKQEQTTEQLYCLPKKDERPHFRAIIATVADPELTHLSLDFDRDVESIVWAIGDEGYALENYWFPWQPHPDKEETDPEKRKAAKADQDDRLRKPGLILFRCTKGPRASEQKLLAVFVVGETPTFGPSRLAFNAALEGIGT